MLDHFTELCFPANHQPFFKGQVETVCKVSVGFVEIQSSFECKRREGEGFNILGMVIV